MQYRLIKSEPYKYSREQFCKDKKTMRDGVRNFEARNNLRSMKKWDLCFWYHSNEGKEIVWIAVVSKEAYPDTTTQWEKGDWVVVEVKPNTSLPKSITLEAIKLDKQLSHICLLKRQRLSVAPVTKLEFDRLLTIAGK